MIPFDFANQLTTDLYSVSKDKHIRVRFNPEGVATQVFTAEDSLKFHNQYMSQLKRQNFGFKELKVLDGNIAYLDLRSFSDVEYGGATAVSAMNFLSNSDAIIIDLRMNGGGSPAMIQLITSYLFSSDPVHLNNFYWRPTDSHTQTWTLPHVQGIRSPEKDVYILTSSRTFSAAEEFSYNLKHLKRATLIGETTGGGAHPGGTVDATHEFSIFVPSGRAINPITNTNWEGIGVVPHIKVSADDALETAQIKALESLKSSCGNPELKQYYDWYLSLLEVTLNPVNVKGSILETYVGSYGVRTITSNEGRLFYQRESGDKYELLPLNERVFMLEGMTDFRIEFVKEENRVTGIKGLYENGYQDLSPRDLGN